jgi:prolyl 4-hydroxylase
LRPDRRVKFEVRPKKGRALIFFPGFMNGELDTDALHAGMPAVDTKWVSQVWIRQSFREDGQPSTPVPESEQTLIGPLHEGFYRGCCLAGDDVYEADMTIEEAKAYTAAHDQILGFTYNTVAKDPRDERGNPARVKIWFKSKLNVLYNETWWSYSAGRGMD